jgi:hypothetical protein
MGAVSLMVRALSLSACLVASAYGQAPDVGLVNMLSGEVAYHPEAGAASKAQAFMRVRQGDRFDVPSGALLRVVYFEGGRQETWQGPVVFRAAPRQSEGATIQPAAVNTLPPPVPSRIAQVPDLIQIAKLGRSGGVAVRGGGRAPRLSPVQQAEVSAARTTYKQLRSQSTPEDITAELFLYSVLQDFLLYEQMKPVVDEMAKRQPSNAEVQELAAWVKSKSQ